MTIDLTIHYKRGTPFSALQSKAEKSLLANMRENEIKTNTKKRTFLLFFGDMGGKK